MPFTRKGIRVCFLMLFTFEIMLPSFGQHNSSFKLESIQFEGLKKTQESYLKRFLNSKAGITTDSTQVQFDVQQLRNLNAIGNANFRLEKNKDGFDLIFELEEALTFFPIINFGGIKNNFWYQLGATDSNWLGKGRQFTAYYQNNDGKNNFSLFYRNPYVKATPIGYSFAITKYSSFEPVYFDVGAVNYDYDNYSASVMGSYEVNLNHSLELSTTYFIERFRKSADQILESAPGPEDLRQPKLLGKISNRFHKINFHFFYLSGFDNVSIFESVYNLDDQSLFNLFLNDTRYFKRFGKKGNLAARFRLGISTNTNTPFAPFVLDSQVNIRGSGNRIDRGTAMLILNLEHRQTLFESPKIAVQGIAFSDIGTWRSPGGGFSDLVESDNFRFFLGGGIRLIYKKAHNAIIRFDYGHDIFNANKNGIVLGIGQYF